MLFYSNTFHTTVNDIGDSGESIFRALQTNTSLTSLDISRVLFCLNTFHTQQMPALGDSGAQQVSIALQSNTSLTSLDISRVLLFLTNFHTQQIMAFKILVLRAFREHSSQTLHSNLLIFPVIVFTQNTFHTTGNNFRESGAESILRALQSNTSLTSLDISCVFVSLLTRFTKQGTVLVILVLRALQSKHFTHIS